MLRVGTDCSGIDAPVYALQIMKIPHIHVFSSEIDKYCIQSIKANYNPQIIFGDKDGPYPEGDITKRNLDDVPDIDLYVCGFPCQPFSSAGSRKGFSDPRGTVFWSCIELIKHKQPKYFILENVKGLVGHNKGDTWNTILNILDGLKEYNYNVKWKILNTRDYGIPQNRERIFIVGIKDGDFDWPEPIEMDDIKLYIDYNDNQEFTSKTILKYKDKILDSNIFINTDFLKYTDFPDSKKFCPCIGAQNTLWNVSQNRYANIIEYLYLQGFLKFNICISKSKLKKQIGNSISINILTNIFQNILYI
jgi:DNA (cytosine-5)-methyltransferase 1